MAVAFQVSLSERFSGSTTGVPYDARQIAGSNSAGDAPTKARWASTPAGSRVPLTAGARRKGRRVRKRDIPGYSRNADRKREGALARRQRSAATATGWAAGEEVARHGRSIV